MTNLILVYLQRASTSGPLSSSPRARGLSVEKREPSLPSLCKAVFANPEFPKYPDTAIYIRVPFTSISILCTPPGLKPNEAPWERKVH
jgi:hypothetical protein